MVENSPAPKKQLNARLPVDLIARLERVKRLHRMHPTWDTLLELLLQGDETLADLEGAIAREDAARRGDT